MAAGPDLIFVGQVTIDDVVPAEPGPWRRAVGGSALYAIAGARLWIDPARIGIATRTGRGYPFDLEGILKEAGVGHTAIIPIAGEHLIEWLIYEEDGSRRSLPRNLAARDVGAEGSPTLQPFYDVLLGISPTASDIPPAWLPAPAVHLCPQVGTRHRDSLAVLKDKAGWISVDPSPHYSRKLDAAGLADFLCGAAAFLPSAQEVRPLLESMTPIQAAEILHKVGFPEVVLKRGAEPTIIAVDGIGISMQVTPVTIVDPTGAGDSFCGAYAANRLLGHDPVESVRRAAISAALVVGCSGAEQALGLTLPAR
ncbi:MAG: ribokinase [Rhodospirillales bacterium]|nr:ribokinase [Rhodospirillales bacterium]